MSTLIIINYKKDILKWIYSKYINLYISIYDSTFPLLIVIYLLYSTKDSKYIKKLKFLFYIIFFKKNKLDLIIES